MSLGRSEEFWPWMSHVLLPYVHGNQSSPELGPPRLRQVRLREGERLLATWLNPSPAPRCSPSGRPQPLPYGLREGVPCFRRAQPRQPVRSELLVSRCSFPAALCPDPPGSGVPTCFAASGSFSTGDYGVGWGSAAHNGSETWAYSAPDLLG